MPFEIARVPVISKSKFVFVTGISSFAENPEGVSDYLQPFLDYARYAVHPPLEPRPRSFCWSCMRSLTKVQQVEILKEICRFFKTRFNLRIDPASSAVPCDSGIRTITGEEKGLFGWLTVNFLMGGFTGHSQDLTTYEFLDMGGVSTQIVFEPSLAERGNPNSSLAEVRLKLLAGR
jgi:Golgi apyrase